jgi:23S rRNA (pseudouridine1915-N3)-methyltransferase
MAIKVIHVLLGAFIINHAFAFVSTKLSTSPSFHHTIPSSGTFRSTVNTRLSLMKVTIRIVGRKPGSSDGTVWLDQGVSMYTQRLERVMTLTTEWHKSNESLVKNMESDAHKGHAIIVLDPTIGTQYTSEVFSDQFYKWMQIGGSRVVFVIGGAEGLPSQVLASSYPKMSLSKLTFTHQFARLLLVEQVYRAYEINKGSDYHK